MTAQEAKEKIDSLLIYDRDNLEKPVVQGEALLALLIAVQHLLREQN